jgi:NIPSNAP protein
MASTFNRWNFRGWLVCSIVMISLAAGSVIAAGLVHVRQVRADSSRVFELRIYHPVPGKLPALEARFRDTTSKLLAKHDLKVVGYWVGEDAAGGDDTFIYMLEHASREAAKKNWGEFVADPAFQEVIKAEQAEKLVEKEETTFMRATDFSPMK